MTYTYNNKGTCSVRTVVELNDDHTIKSVQVLGGCDGNLKGIAKLLPGMKAEDAIARMEGTTCGRKPTSCPDQIAQALRGRACPARGLPTGVRRIAVGRCKHRPRTVGADSISARAVCGSRTPCGRI